MIARLPGCVFCNIVAGEAPVRLADPPRPDRPYVVFQPLNPHAPGHVLFVPRRHFASAAEAPVVTGILFEAAASWAAARYDDFNLLTSSGAKATQTVEHLHIHVIPRSSADGLHHDWPWCRE